MVTNKLIRLTIQVDIEPEKANLGEALDYLKGLKGAERVELTDLEVVKDPRAEEKKQRRELDRSFGGGELPLPPLPEAPERTAGNNGSLTDNPQPEPDQTEEKSTRVLDRIKLR